MLRIRAIPTAALALVLLASLHGLSAAGALSTSASCGGGNLSFSWTFYEDPQNPVAHPEWVGYDVMRRSLAQCGSPVRLNASPYPRVPGVTHGYTYTEPPPAPGTTFEYRVVLVDANRQPVTLDPVSCDFCGSASVNWASCPEFSAPLTQGTLEDLGWALIVQPCGDGCYQSFYFSGPRAVELRPYAGTGTALRLYGSAVCGTVEGCAIDIDHYDLAPCGPTPVLRASWGRVKAIYR